MLSEAALTESLKDAMRAQDAVKVSTLRLLKVALHNESIALGHPLTETEQIAILRRELKRREEAITAFTNAHRLEQAATETAEAEILRAYLPAALSETQLREIVKAVIAQQPSEKPIQPGPIIGQVLRQVGAQSDGTSVTRLVQELLGK